MPYLPNIIKRIDAFYNLTQSLTRLRRMAAPEIWTMPDDPEEEEVGGDLPGDEWVGLYPNIVAIADQLGEQADDVSNELRLIAELYKKALEINGGYSQLGKAISISLANIDSLIDESDGVIGEDVRDAAESILEEVASDLRQRAKSSIGQQMDEAAAMKELRAVKQAFNQQEARQEMESQKSIYEKGKPGAETGHSINVPVVPETPQKYAREIKRLQELLEQEKDQNIKQTLIELQRRLKLLIRQMQEVGRISGELKVIPDDVPKQQELEAATKKLESLRDERRLLQSRLNNFLLGKDKDELISQLSQTRNLKEQEWIQERINLLDLRMDSKTLKKRDVIKALKAKVNSMGIINERGDFESLNWELAKDVFNKAISEGQSNTITKSDYDRGLTEQRGLGQGREDIPKLPSDQRGGWRPVVQKDFSMFTFPALIKELRDRKNTAIDSARRYMTNEKERGKPELKEDVKAVSDAIRKKDHAAKFKAIMNLKKKIEISFTGQKDAFQSYRRSIKLLPIFNRFETALTDMATWQTENGQWIVKDQALAQNVVSDIAKLSEQYAKYYQSKNRPQFTYDITPRFDAMVKFLPRISRYIEQNMLKNRDYEEELSPKQASIFERYAQDINLNELDLKKKKREYDRMRSEQKGLEQGREEIPNLPSEHRGGWRPTVQKDFSIFTFPALIKELRDKINTAIDTSRKDIHSIKVAGHPTFKPFIDEISKAIRKKDNAAKFTAIMNLRTAINNSSGGQDNFSREGYAFQSYRRSLKLVPIFKTIENSLITMKDWQNSDGKWQPKDIGFVQDTMSNMVKLTEQYAKYYQNNNQPKFTIGIKPRFDTALRFLPRISHYLKQNVLQSDAGEMNDK